MLSELQVKHWLVLAPPGFRRNLQNLNPCGETEVYIWEKIEKMSLNPIADIITLSGIGVDAIPFGYIKIAKCLNPNDVENKFIFLAYKNVDGEKDMSYINEISVTLDDQTPLVVENDRRECSKILISNPEAKIKVWLWIYKLSINDDDLSLSKLSLSEKSHKKKRIGGTFDIDSSVFKDFKKKLSKLDNHGAFNDPQNVEFWEKQLPEFVDKCLTSVFPDKELATQVHYTLNAILSTCITGFFKDLEKPMSNASWNFLTKILGVDNNSTYFYDNYGTESLSISTLRRSSDQIYSRQYKGQSGFLIETINHFGELDGFQIILDRICKTNPPLPYEELDIYIRIIEILSDFLENDFKKPFFKKFFEAISFRLANVTEEEIKNYDIPESDRSRKPTIKRILLSAEEIVQNVLLPYTVHEVLELFELAFSKRLINCSVLNKQRLGVSMITKMIERTNIRAQGFKYRDNPHLDKLKPTYYLSTESLASWLVKEQVVECIFSEKHIEVVRISKPILSVIALCSMMNKSHIDIIWKFGEADQMEIVYEIFNELSKDFDADLVEIIWSKLSTLSVSKLTLPLLLCFTNRALEVKPLSRPVGLDLFYNAIFLQNQLNFNVTKSNSDTLAIEEEAFKMLTEILGKENLIPFISEFIDKSLANLKSGNNVIMSLKLLRMLILESLRNEKDSYSVLQSFCEKNKICEVLIADIKRFKNEILKDKDYEKRFTHKDQIEKRLDFFQFIGCCLTVSHIEAIAKELCESMDNNSFGELFMSWFERIITNLELDNAPLCLLFKSLLCNQEISIHSNTSLSLYSCFETFFIHINKIYENLSYLYIPEKFKVTNFYGLIGIEELWEIYCNCCNDAISSAASQLFINLHVRLSTSTKNKNIIWTEQFINKCIDRLITSMELVKLNDAVFDKEMKVCELLVDKMSLFFSQLNSLRSDDEKDAVRRGSMTDSVINEINTQSLPLEITVEFTCRKNRHYYSKRCPDEYFTPSSISFGDFRAIIAEDYDIPLNLVRLANYYNNSIIDSKEDSKLRNIAEQKTVKILVSFLKVPDSTTKYASSSLLSLCTVTEEERFVPKASLSNTPKYFHALFDLLGFSKSTVVVNKAWALIQDIELNKETYESIRTFNNTMNVEKGIDALMVTKDIHFDDIISSKSVLKLLYELQIVNQLLFADDFGVVSDWTKQFLIVGGLAHLNSILFNFDMTCLSSTLNKKCLVSLLNTLKVLYETASCNLGLYSTHKEFEDDVLLKISNQLSSIVIHLSKLDGDNALRENESSNFSQLVSKTNQNVDANLIESLFQFLQDLIRCIDNYNILSIFYTKPEFEPSILQILLQSKDSEMRIKMKQCMISMCNFTKSLPFPLNTCSKFLVPFVDAILQSYEYSETSEQYFEVSREIIAGAANDQLDVLQNLFDMVSNLLLDHSIVELEETNEDFVLRGLLSTLSSLVLRKDLDYSTGVDLIKFLCENGLFYYPEDEKSFSSTSKKELPPICKNKITRAFGFQLLLDLALLDSKNLVLFAKYFSGRIIFDEDSTVSTNRLLEDEATISASTQLRLWKADNLNKSSTGFVGIQNLGFICYLNSIMQQFYMTPSFRRGILDLNGEFEEKIIAELQYLFAQLQESVKQAVSPLRFCQNFKDWDGNPIDVTVQQDANEFLTQFFQKLESATSGTKYEAILKESFSGTFCNTLSAESKIQAGKNYYSEKHDSFQFISLDLEKTLQQSFETYISPEIVEYKWEMENGEKEAIPTKKRVFLGSLPNSLILHLKRFKYDYETNQQSKINSFMEFPMELDLKSFTKEGAVEVSIEKNDDLENDEETKGSTSPKPSSYYKYELMGIVIHQGAAQSGHYFSYIRDRSSTTANPLWYEFNDTLVTPFHHSEIPSNAFGGEMNSKSTASIRAKGSPYEKAHNEKTHNALLLFYDRKRDEDDNLESSNNPIPVSVSPKLMQEILKDNLLFIEKRNLNYPDFGDFLEKLLHATTKNKINGNGGENVLFAKYFIKIILKNKLDPIGPSNWIEDLCTRLSRDPFTSMSLLSDLFLKNKETFRDILMDPYFQPTTTMFISSIINSVYLYIDSDTGNVEEKIKYKSFLRAQIMDPIFSITMEMKSDCTIPYLKLIEQMLELPNCALSLKKFILSQELLDVLVSYYLGEAPNSRSYNNQKNLFLTLISIMVRCIIPWEKIPKAITVSNYTTLIHPGVPFNDIANNIFPQVQNTKFLGFLLLNSMINRKFFSISRSIIQHLYYENDNCNDIIKIMQQQLSSDFENCTRSFTSGISLQAHPNLKSCFYLAEILMGIKDNFTDKRQQEVMSAVLAPLSILSSTKERSYFVTEACIEFLLRIAYRSEEVKKWLVSHKDSWIWIDSFLNRKVDISIYSAHSHRDFIPTWRNLEYKKQDMIDRVKMLQSNKADDLLLDYNSDTPPEELVGKRVLLKLDSKARKAKVTKFNPENGKYTVKYDNISETEDRDLQGKQCVVII